MTATTATRDALTAGSVRVTVRPDPHWRFAQTLLGAEWHEEYTYLITRVENDHGHPTFFLKTQTERRDGTQSFVYTGIVDPRNGNVRLTTKSAFPETATRVRVARKVLAALFAGRGADVDAAGWEVEVEVLLADENRF